MKLTEDNISDYAETLVMQARGRGVELNFSESSLALLEQLFAISDRVFKEAASADMQRNLVVFYGGCYLGEVLARNYGGVWKFEENWFESTINFTIAEGGMQIRPFHKIHYRITEGSDKHNLIKYQDGLKEKLHLV